MTTANHTTESLAEVSCTESVPTPEARGPGRHTYGQILKSSALIGGSSAVNVGIGIIRTKAIAVLLGPSGFGLMGLYGSILNFAQAIASMGVNSSGVRQIAAAVGSGDGQRIAQTAAVLRRTAIFLGLLGAVLLVVLCKPVSKLSFDNYDHAVPVALLSLAVFFQSVSGGQGALIQGMRRIGDLAKMGVLGSVGGTVLTIVLVYLFREQGVVPALIAIAGMSVLTSWWFSRKVKFDTPPMSTSQIGREAASLLKLGFAFLASGMLTMGAAYAVRIIVVRKIGFDAAGFYQSAWTLGVLYIGFILQAMGADFYPRLTATIQDHNECNRLVNEQAQISLLLAGPGLIATLTFAPVVIALFYSAKFSAAVPLLRWICLGATLQVITWPLGFIVVAKARQNIFFACELAYTAVYLGLAWVCIGRFGLEGAGVAFFGSYVFHTFLIYPVVRRLTGFRWSAANRQTGVVYLVSVGLTFGSFWVLPFWLATAVGTLTLLLVAAYSIRILSRLVPFDRIPRPVKQLLVWTRLASASNPP